jgi:hypothetical protein
MVVGGMWGWTTTGPLGFLWRLTIMPAYATMVVATLILRAAGIRTGVPVVLAIAVLVDLLFALGRKALHSRTQQHYSA